jgi:hypothetical protein
LPGVFRQEKEVSKLFTDSTKYRVQQRNGREYKSYTSAFAKAYSAPLGKTINQRLVASANLVADFWYTCWVDAGCPALPTTKKKENSLQEEQHAFKHNKLIEKKLLIARQGNEAE